MQDGLRVRAGWGWVVGGSPSLTIGVLTGVSGAITSDLRCAGVDSWLVGLSFVGSSRTVGHLCACFA